MPEACPLVGMPPVERAWSARRGDVVFLRLPASTHWARYDEAREVLDAATAKTGVEFILLAPGVELVPSDGADA